MLSMWAILKKFGRSLVAQAPAIATSSGSSWFVNQLLFSKKTSLTMTMQVPAKRMCIRLKLL